MRKPDCPVNEKLTVGSWSRGVRRCGDRILNNSAETVAAHASVVSARSRIRLPLLAFGIAALLLAAAAFAYWIADSSRTVSRPLPAASWSHNSGYMFTSPIPDLREEANTNEQPQRSPYIVLEDGRPLTTPHAMHADIVSMGAGRYSHWQDLIYISTPDNSDPAANGRTYTLWRELPANFVVANLLLAAAVLSAFAGVIPIT